MDLGHGISVDYQEGELVMKAQGNGFEIVAKGQVAGLALPVLDQIRAKVESGEIDPIKGTEFDKAMILQVIDTLKASLVK